MYTPTQIELIKLFWKKDLTFGCFAYAYRDWYNSKQLYKNVWGNKYVLADIWDFDFISKDEWDVEILWHIPHLEDVFRVAIEKWFHVSLALQSRWEYFLSIYGSDTQNFYLYNPTLPLIDQPEETLTQLLTLFKSC